MKSYPVELTTADGTVINFECPENQSLLAAAAAANIVLPSLCGQGTCAACHAFVTAGDFVMGEHDPDAVPVEPGQTAVLLCCSYPRSPMRLAAPYEHSRVLFQPNVAREAVIAELGRVAETTVRLLVRLVSVESEGVTGQFVPGQFVELEIPGTDIKRTYSIANDWDGKGPLEFLIRLQPLGRFSEYLMRDARVGEKLHVWGPRGTFHLEEADGRSRWFVAGGTGLAPILSMLRRIAKSEGSEDVRLFFGVNSEADVFAVSDMERLKSDIDTLKVEVCVWNPRDSWSGFVGTPVDALRRDLRTANAMPDVYLCGPPALIDSAAAVAREYGVTEEHIFSERFVQS